MNALLQMRKMPLTRLYYNLIVEEGWKEVELLLLLIVEMEEHVVKKGMHPGIPRG